MQTVVEIRQMGSFGQGVGFDEKGNVYFVSETLPGDKAMVSFDVTHKKYREGKLIELISPSSERRTALCPYFTQCGGCDWMHWDYPAQLKAKEKIISHTLSRAGLAAKNFLPALEAPQTFGYRRRIQLRQKGNKLGFYKRRSHEVVDIETCAVAHPLLNERLRELRSDLSANGKERKIELVLDDHSVVRQWNNQPHSAGGFTQINAAQNQILQERVQHYIKKSGSKNVLELFCGNGNLTKAYFQPSQKIMAVDSNAFAIERAKIELPRVQFLRNRVDGALKGKLQGFEYDTLVLNPPRDGAGGVLSFVSESLRNILYVSCSPVAFTMDMHPLRDAFELIEVQPIDMFPHTHHIEFVAWFARRISAC